VTLRDKTALVTGGSRGIGKGIALRLAKDGARVAIAYRSNKGAAQDALRQLQAEGAECFAVEGDVTHPEQAKFLVEAATARFGRLDIVVNNVGAFGWSPVAETSIEDWQRILASNLMSVLYVCKAALPHMHRQRWGRIVNMGAVRAGRAFGQATISAYAASKAAVVSFSRSLALEEAKNGITVNVVNPAIVDNRDLTRDEARRVRDARVPVGRPPTPEDVAEAVAFFVSDGAEFITGQVLSVAGGWML
jgi:3-oxoacyl-[acyl-carrier protein] reductase